LTALRHSLEAPLPERERWIKQNLLDAAEAFDLSDHLGSQRIAALQNSWRTANTASRTSRTTRPATKSEKMILTAAAYISDIIEETAVSFIFAGIGASSLAAWVAYARAKHEFPVLVSETGFFDYHPLLGDPWLFATANIQTCSILSDTETILGAMVQGDAHVGLAILAAAQVDRAGRLNTTYAGERFITGSGGANDAASAIGDVIVVVPHDRGRLVERVDYVTSPGARTRAIITDRAIFQRHGDEFIIEAVVQTTAAVSLSESVELALEDTPWPVGVSDDVYLIDSIDPESLQLLRSFDPSGYFLTESIHSSHRVGPPPRDETMVEPRPFTRSPNH
jgi:acyl CoA:acetate/3-ketoacid CoA transferase beta subunit